MRLITLILLLSILNFQNVFCQNSTIDSLSLELQKAAQDTIKIDLLNKLALSYIRINKDSSIILAKKALRLSQQLNYSKGEASSLLAAGISHAKHGNLIEAMLYLEKAKKMAEELNYVQIKANSLNYIGLVQIRNGNYPLALDIFQEALEIAESLKNLSIISDILNHFGGLYFDQEDYSQALFYWEQGLEIRLKLTNNINTAGSLNNLGLVYSNLGDYTKSLKYYYQALSYYDEKTLCPRIYPYSNIANIYYLTNKLDSAEYVYNSVITMMDSCPDPLIEIWTLRGLARVSAKKEKYTNAIDLYKQALIISEQRDMKVELRSLFAELSETYEALGEKTLALEYHKKYTAIGDSLFNSENAKAIGKLEAKYEFEKNQREKDMESQLLEIENQRKIRYNRIFVFALLIILILSILFLIHLLKSRAQYNKKSKELEIANTDLHDTINNLRNAQKQLLQSEKMASLGILSAGVAHEINNPLNFINGGILGLRDAFAVSNCVSIEEVNHIMQIIEEGVDRASDIVSALNRFCQQTDNMEEECDLHEIIDRSILMIRQDTKDRIIIRKDYSDFQFKVIGNESRLHQVMINILTNAMQAISEEGKISIKTVIEKDQVKLLVHDSGQGIKKEIISKVFDTFFTTKDPGKGTGIGLSIAYSIVKEHNGSIEINSIEGEGTEVSITFPIIKSKDTSS